MDPDDVPQIPQRDAFPFASTARLLLAWYERARRALPWRESSDAYRVWVSEVMLQQTRVEVVVDRYRRFLARFPTVEALAAAHEDDVVAEWSGLGYYRRARALHRGARAVVAEHGGAFPSELDAALRLPGVGRYTAGAVLSIAYNLSVPAVDGNVERVVSRLLARDDDPRRGRGARHVQEFVRDWIPAGRAAEFNQALMELGATVCTPRSPRCDSCPVAPACHARAAGDPETYPRAATRPRSVPVHLHAAVIERDGRFLLERVRGRPFLEGLWLFPFVEAPAPLLAALSRRLGIELRLGASLGVVRHSITFRRITLEAFEVDGRELARVVRDEDLRWAAPGDFGDTIPVSSLALKVLAIRSGSAPLRRRPAARHR